MIIQDVTEELLRKNRRLLVECINEEVGGRFPQYDFDDFMQEASLAFLKAHRRYDSTKMPYEPFVKLCVKRRLADFYKVYHKYDVQAENYLPLAEPEDEDCMLAILSDYAKVEELCLESKSRCVKTGFAVLRLIVDGYSPSDAAEKLGLSPATARSYVMRTKKYAQENLPVLVQSRMSSVVGVEIVAKNVNPQERKRKLRILEKEIVSVQGPFCLIKIKIGG